MISSRAKVVGALALLVHPGVNASWGMRPTVPMGQRPTPSAVMAAAPLGVSATTVQRLVPVRAADATLTVPMSLDGAPVALRLSPHDVRASSFQLLVVGANGAERRALPPATHAYRGTVDGLPVGVQLVGHRGRDALLLALGRVLEVG